MFTNTKRKKKNGKLIFAKHMIERDVNFIIRMFNFKFRNNRRNEKRKRRISERRKRGKEAPKTTFNRI